MGFIIGLKKGIMDGSICFICCTFCAELVCLCFFCEFEPQSGFSRERFLAELEDARSRMVLANASALACTKDCWAMRVARGLNARGRCNALSWKGFIMPIEGIAWGLVFFALKCAWHSFVERVVDDPDEDVAFAS